MTEKIKRTLFTDQPRNIVIESMAKKLATHGNTDFVAVGKRSRFKIVWPIAGFVLLLVVVSVFLHRKPEQDDPLVTQAPSVLTSPVAGIRAAYDEGRISANQYAQYLGYILIRYDSLPEHFRIDRPVIRDSEVYAAIEQIWERVGQADRVRLISEVPGLEQRMRSSQENASK